MLSHARSHNGYACNLPSHATQPAHGWHNGPPRRPPSHATACSPHMLAHAFCTCAHMPTHEQSHNGQAPVLQKQLHGLVGAPGDGGCRHMEEHTRPQPRPKRLVPLSRRYVPHCAHLHEYSQQLSIMLPILLVFCQNRHRAHLHHRSLPWLLDLNLARKLTSRAGQHQRRVWVSGWPCMRSSSMLSTLL